MAEAIACFQEVLRIDPSSAASHNNLGVAYARLGNEEQALRHFTQAQQLDPTDAEAYYNEGLLLARAGRPEEAGRRYAEALRVRPGYADAHYQLGLSQAAQGRVPCTVPGWFTGNDCLHLGCDLGSPVSPDYFDQAPFAFNGTLGTTHIKHLKK